MKWFTTLKKSKLTLAQDTDGDGWLRRPIPWLETINQSAKAKAATTKITFRDWLAAYHFCFRYEDITGGMLSEIKNRSASLMNLADWASFTSVFGIFTVYMFYQVKLIR